MNKSSNKILIALAILALIGVGIFIGMKPKQQNRVNTSQDTTRDEITNADEEMTINGNILDLVKSGNSTKCTYTTSTADVKVQGTAYVTGKRIRTDMTSSISGGQNMESHMISDGEWFYTWSSAMPQGFKIKIDEVTKDLNGDISSEETNKALKDFQTKVDYKCTKWVVDEAKFVLPTNVQFSDYTQMMTPPQGQNNMCAACNYIQDAEAKAQCMSRLNCK